MGVAVKPATSPVRCRRIYPGDFTDLGSRNDSGLNAQGGFSDLG